MSIFLNLRDIQTDRRTDRQTAQNYKAFLYYITAERSFSGLKRIKSYLRSSIKQERLSSLTVINLENENLELIDLEEVIDEFASYKDRRMKFH